MYGTDEDRTCMGEGKFGCGAMGVMGPFDSFLTMTGKVPGDEAACP